jgi:Icc-related predicted phosphoesterase
MKILAFCGSHENEIVVDAFLDWVGRLEPPDVFVSAGDLGPRSMERIFESLARYDKPLLYVLGNHSLHYPPNIIEDSIDAAKALPKTYRLQEESPDLGCAVIGQDAWTDFTDDERDPHRYFDLKRRTQDLSGSPSILVTHHAPLGVFDSGHSYPLHAYVDAQGLPHAGSLALRYFVDEFSPRIHIFAHCHSDGCRHALIDGTLFVNVCHLERRTRSGRFGLSGSFVVIDTDELAITVHHLGARSPSECPQCGRTNYILYGRCVNCMKGTAGVIAHSELP